MKRCYFQLSTKNTSLTSKLIPFIPDISPRIHNHQDRKKLHQEIPSPNILLFSGDSPIKPGDVASRLHFFGIKTDLHLGKISSSTFPGRNPPNRGYSPFSENGGNSSFMGTELSLMSYTGPPIGFCTLQIPLNSFQKYTL